MADMAATNEAIKRCRLAPGVNLSLIRTGKFKTGYFSAFFLRELNEAEAAQNALITSVLLRGSRTLPDMKAIAAREGELYGAKINPVIRQLGEVQAFGLTVSFADDRFLPGGERLLEEVIAFAGELLLDPATRGGLLNSDYVASEKANLCDRINSLVNNKGAYAQERMKRHMFKNEKYSVYLLGSAESAERITAQGLTRHYKRVLAESRLELFYCGSAEEERISAAVRKAFRTLPHGTERPDVATELITECGEPKYVSETMSVTQGNLALGFRLGEVMRDKLPDYAALAVFNAIYGGSINSKLFLNVRERLSLCYDVHSGIDRQKGVMTVSAGIDFSKYGQALETILDMLELCRKGDISDEELNTAKKVILTDLKSASDSAVYLDAFWLRQTVSGLDYGPEVFAALVEEVTKEKVVRVARSVRLDTVYFLKGEEAGV